VAPAVITKELSADFGLSAASLGNLSAFYFYGYVAVQIPTGLLADRFGPRRVLSVGAAATAVGTLLFALAPGVALANAGRFAIGVAAGVAFVSMLKLASHWMPSRQFAFVSGVALFTGVVGATLAGAPLRMAVDAFGWREVMVASAAVTFAAAIGIWMVVRDDPAERGFESYFPSDSHGTAAGSMASQVREVLSYRNTWLLLVIPGAFSGIILTFPGLWGVPFLVSQYGFTTREAATLASAMLIAWSASSMAYGPLSQRMGRRKPVYAGGLVAIIVFWSIVVFVPGMPRAVLVAVLLAVSVAGAAFIVNFAFAKESVPARLAGTVSGIANMGVMLGGMLMQPLVGFVLDRHWDGAIADGARVYSFAAYQWGFALMLAWAAVALVLLAFTRETYCRGLR
jgi:sugar phosphate permease